MWCLIQAIAVHCGWYLFSSAHLDLRTTLMGKLELMCLEFEIPVFSSYNQRDWKCKVDIFVNPNFKASQTLARHYTTLYIF